MFSCISYITGPLCFQPDPTAVYGGRGKDLCCPLSSSRLSCESSHGLTRWPGDLGYTLSFFQLLMNLCLPYVFA